MEYISLIVDLNESDSFESVDCISNLVDDLIPLIMSPSVEIEHLSILIEYCQHCIVISSPNVQTSICFVSWLIATFQRVDILEESRCIVNELSEILLFKDVIWERSFPLIQLPWVYHGIVIA